MYGKLLISLYVGLFSFVLLYNFKSLPTFISVKISATYKLVDTLQIYYTDKENEEFTESKSISHKVVGSDNSQTIDFKLPVDISKFRLDMSSNDNQKSIEIDRIDLSSKSNSISLADNIHENFRLNNIQLDNKTLITKSDSGKYNPSLVSLLTPKDLAKFQTKFRKFSLLSSLLISSLIFSLVVFILTILNFRANIKIVQQNLFIATFISILNLPLFGKLLSLDYNMKDFEKRKLHKKPTLSLNSEFCTNYENYYNDNFKSRQFLINTFKKLKLNIFHYSPKPDHALIGKDDFIFYNTEYSMYPSYSNSNQYNSKELKYKRSILQKRKEKLDSLGIDYIGVISPNKHTVYFDKMPYVMKIQKSSNISLSDQIYNLASKDSIHFVDIRSDLINKKDNRQLYKKLDTHWNGHGAYLAYKSIFNQTENLLNIKPYERSAFAITDYATTRGDLTNTLGVKQVLDFEDRIPVYKLINQNLNFEKVDVDKKLPKGTIITRNKNCDNDLKVLIFRDSYSTELVQFLSLHFGEVIYIWEEYSQKYVDEFKPDVVFSIIVERHAAKI